MKLKSSCIILLSINSLSVSAEVTLDGTLGRTGALPGPNYLIGADLGRQHGGNLFHSFQDFNLNNSESATFSGPNNVQNILSRVTGGNPSNIDWLIRSTIPNADMYFLNPNGIMFGPNAQLDVQGGFHASTADYLRLGEDGRFDARNPSDSLLTVAPVEAFGFLKENPAHIYSQNNLLQVLPGKEFTIVGGNITMERSGLLIPDGMIGIASVASQGEIIRTESDLLLSSFDNLGDISISRGGQKIDDYNKWSKFEKAHGKLDVKGEQGGQIIIRGKNLLLDDRTAIKARTEGGGPGKGIDIKVSGTIKLLKTSSISTSNLSFGQGGSINIEANRLELTGGAQISLGTWGTGESGQMTIKANEILLSDIGEFAYLDRLGHSSRQASGLFSASLVKKGGMGGTMNIEAKRLVIEELAQINVASRGTGNAGSINLNVEQLEIRAGAIISSTVGLGNGGSINIKANDIVLSEVGSINSSGFGPSEGQAGDITIEAENMELINGGNINISTLGLGKSGAINIKVSNSLKIEGQADDSMSFFYDFVNIQSGGLLPIAGVMLEDLVGPSKISAAVINLGPESAGNIDIEAGRLWLQNGAKITGEHRGMGDAGDIGIRASDFRLKQSTITTETFGGGGGGNISLNTSNLLYLREGNITTSVGTGRGQGGDITISEPTFIVLNQGQIKAQADEGQGGNIRIVADQFITSPDSLISASSRLGLDGNVQIESPAVDLDAMLVVLPGGYVEEQLPKGCNIEDISERNTFYVYPEHEGKMRTPADFPE